MFFLSGGLIYVTVVQDILSLMYIVFLSHFYIVVSIGAHGVK